MCRRRYYSCDMMIADEADKKAGKNYCKDSCMMNRKDGWVHCDQVKSLKRVHPTSKNLDKPLCEEQFPPCVIMRPCPKCKRERREEWPVIEANREPEDPEDARFKAEMEQWLGGANVLLDELNENAKKEAEVLVAREAAKKIEMEQKAGKSHIVLDSLNNMAEKKDNPTSAATMKLLGAMAQGIRDVKKDFKNGTNNPHTPTKLSHLQNLGGVSLGQKRPADTTFETSQSKMLKLQLGQTQAMRNVNTSEDNNKSYNTTNLQFKPADKQQQDSQTEVLERRSSFPSNSLDKSGHLNPTSVNARISRPSLPVSKPRPSKILIMEGHMARGGFKEQQQSLRSPFNAEFNLNGPSQPANNAAQAQTPSMAATQKPLDEHSASTSSRVAKNHKNYEATQPCVPNSISAPPALATDRPAFAMEAVPGQVAQSTRANVNMALGKAQQGQRHVNSDRFLGASNPSNTGHTRQSKISEFPRPNPPRSELSKSQIGTHARPPLGPSCNKLPQNSEVPDFAEIQRSVNAAWDPALSWTAGYIQWYKAVPSLVRTKIHGAQAGYINRELGVPMQNQIQESAAVQGTRNGRFQTDNDPAAGGPVQYESVQYKQDEAMQHEAQEPAAVQTAPDQRFQPDNVLAARTPVRNGPVQFEQPNMQMQGEFQGDTETQVRTEEYQQAGEMLAPQGFIQHEPVQYEQLNVPMQHEARDDEEAQVGYEAYPQTGETPVAQDFIQNEVANYEQPIVPMQAQSENDMCQCEKCQELGPLHRFLREERAQDEMQDVPMQYEPQEAAANQSAFVQPLQAENIPAAVEAVNRQPGPYEQPDVQMQDELQGEHQGDEATWVDCEESQHAEEAAAAHDLLQQQLARDEERYAQMQSQPQQVSQTHGPANYYQTTEAPLPEEEQPQDEPVDLVDMSRDVLMENAQDQAVENQAYAQDESDLWDQGANQSAAAEDDLSLSMQPEMFGENPKETSYDEGIDEIDSFY